jgi:hypothetical protein
MKLDREGDGPVEFEMVRPGRRNHHVLTDADVDWDVRFVLEPERERPGVHQETAPHSFRHLVRGEESGWDGRLIERRCGPGQFEPGW